MPSFDPRVHSMVAMVVKEKQGGTGTNRKPEDLPLKTFVMGPHVPAGQRVLGSAGGSPLQSPRGPEDRRPLASTTEMGGAVLGTAEATARRAREAAPTYLDTRTGQWIPSKLPSPTGSNPMTRPVTVGDTTTAAFGTQRGPRGIRPVAAIHTYLDVSPVASAEFVRDSSHPTEVTSPNGQTLHATVPTASMRDRVKSAGPLGSPKDARTATQMYWGIKGSSLSAADLVRVEELGKKSVPASANTRLIGGRWRLLPRPVDGDVVYTDYYGPIGGGKEVCNYYGRQYNMGSNDFHKNRMVEDLHYLKVQASMSGIDSLRNRPGLVVDAVIAHGDPDTLSTVDADQVAARPTAGVHRLTAFDRMRPATATSYVKHSPF